MLRKNKELINIKDSSGNTALHIAISNGFIDIVKLLLLYNADFNLPDLFKRTPLYLAYQKNQ